MPVKNKNRQSNSGYEGVITGLNDEEKKVLEDAGIGGGDIWLDIAPYLNEDMTSISQEGYDLVSNAFLPEVENPSNKYAGILFMVYKMIFNGIAMSDKIGLNFIANIDDHGVKGHIRASIYDDKSVELIDEAASSSNKIWYDLDTMSGTITQNQYDEIKLLIDSNSLAGLAFKTLSTYCPLANIFDGGIFVFRGIGLGLESTGADRKNAIDESTITIKPDLSITFSLEEIFFPVLTQNLSNQSIISVKKEGYQQNLTIGDGLKIENGALKTTSSGGSSTSVFDITPYLTSSTSISVEGYNALREFVTSNKGGIAKVLISSDYFYYTLCQSNESGMLFTKVGGESHESSDTVIISLMVTSDGSCTFISNTYTPVKANPTESVNGTLSKVRIGNGVYDVVDEAKVNELINSSIGDINTILDNINGEVI